jgi:hypothetical protein
MRETCLDRVVNDSGQWMCIFSGRILGSYVVSTAYGNNEGSAAVRGLEMQLEDRGGGGQKEDDDEPEREDDEMATTMVDFQDEDLMMSALLSSNRGEKEEEEDDEDGEEGDYEERIRKEILRCAVSDKKKGGKDDQPQPPRHSVSSIRNLPKGGLATMSVDDEHSIANVLREIEHKIAVIDGDIQYDKEKVALRTLQQQVDQVVEDLLGNAEGRRRINDELELGQRDLALDRVSRYYKNCFQRSMRPVLPVADYIYDQYAFDRSQWLSLELELVSGARRLWLRKIILKLWFVLKNVGEYKRTRHRLNVREHAVGVLYALKRDLCVPAGTSQNITLIPKDEGVARLLPLPKQLAQIQTLDPKKRDRPEVYEERAITNGLSNLITAFQSIPTELALRLGQILK